jgi:hypothetical protein
LVSKDKGVDYTLIPQQLGCTMGKIKVSQLAEVAGVLRWSLRIEDCFSYFTLAEDGMLELYHAVRTERFTGCSVTAATLAKAMRAAFALCGSKEVRAALTRLSS